MSTPQPEDPVGPDEPLLRRIPHFNDSVFTCVDDSTGETRLSSGNFALEEGEDGVSVYRTHVLETLELEPRCLIRDPLNGVAELPTKVVTDAQLDVKPKPYPDDTGEPEHPRDGAHALILGLANLGKKPRRRVQRALAIASTIVIHPSV
jgi:hypothetical protein